MNVKRAMLATWSVKSRCSPRLDLDLTCFHFHDMDGVCHALHEPFDSCCGCLITSAVPCALLQVPWRPALGVCSHISLSLWRCLLLLTALCRSDVELDSQACRPMAHSLHVTSVRTP